MRRIALAVVFSSLAAAAPAFAASGSLPGGTTLSVSINAPTDGGIVATGAPIPVTGTASVGAAAAPAKDTTLVYTVDVSGSTGSSSGVNCDGSSGSDTVLACEQAAVRQVNTEAAGASSPVANSGLVSFNSVGTAFDFDPGPGVQRLTAPGPAVATAVGGFTAAGGTSFVAALNASTTVLTSPGVQPVKILVFLSDGADTAGGTLPSLPSGTVVKAFAIGGAGCGTGATSLTAVAQKGAAGSSCQQVTNLSVLDDVITDTIAAKLSSIEVAVDGGPATVLGNGAIDPDLPQSGPATVSFSTAVGPLTEGLHQVCVTARGSDAGGAGAATDCRSVQVLQAVVDCGSSPCQLTVTDDGVATATFRGIGITKVVGMSAVDTGPTECGGESCVTGFDVRFVNNGGHGIAELTVVVARPDSTPPGLAAVFIDGAQVTASCTSQKAPLPCQKINSSQPGRTEYFVRFASDPGIRFR